MWKMSSSYTFLADIWFSGVKIVEDVNRWGLDYFGPVNVSLLSSFGPVINVHKIQ